MKEERRVKEETGMEKEKDVKKMVKKKNGEDTEEEKDRGNNKKRVR